MIFLCFGSALIHSQHLYQSTKQARLGTTTHPFSVLYMHTRPSRITNVLGDVASNEKPRPCLRASEFYLTQLQLTDDWQHKLEGDPCSQILEVIKQGVDRKVASQEEKTACGKQGVARGIRNVAPHFTTESSSTSGATKAAISIYPMVARH